MSELNPFIICSTTEQAIYRQHADREVWIVLCRSFGADLAVLEAYDHAAAHYAATTPYPASDVIAYCRRLAYEALKRGEPLPETPQQAVEAENRCAIARLLGG